MTNPGGYPVALTHAKFGADAHETVLHVKNLGRDFGGVQAVKDASFAVPRGVIYGLVGPNGAGKSTVLNIVAGADKPSSGTIEYQTVDVTRQPAYLRARHGLIRTFQLSRKSRALRF